MMDCSDTAVLVGRIEAIDPEEAWLAAEIDALFAAAAARPRRVDTAIGVHRAPRRWSSGVDSLDNPVAGRRPSSRGGRQRAPPIGRAPDR